MEPIRYSSDSSDSENNNNRLDLRQLNLDVVAAEFNLLKNCLNNDIETIYLTHNNIQVFPENLVKFKNLMTLDISYNCLTVLPDIFKYCALRTLIVKNNRLTNESLPKTFTANPNLRELNLSVNLLSHVPEQFLEFTNLKYLYLNGNQITSITSNIYKLHNLNVLSLGGNLLQEVPTTLGFLKQLQGLILHDNLLEGLPANIANLRNLKTLMLHKNKLRTLPPEIVTLKHLTQLSLRENPLVVRFVSDMTHNPASLLELAARAVKIQNVPVKEGDVPKTLADYLASAHHCVNPKCRGVFFDNRVEHIKFVDFCGKYRLPLLEYLCSSKCITTEGEISVQPNRSYLMRKVLLG